MTIRLINILDCEEIYDLWQKTGLAVGTIDVEKYDMKLMLEINSSSCFVGIENEKIIGVIFGAFNGRRAWMYHLAVHPDFQKMGYGSVLLKKAEEALKLRGARKIILGVDLYNTDKISFYEKNGYKIMDDATLLSKLI